MLTLILTTISTFLSAWTILGSIAAPGGTVFALLALIVLALLGGQAIKLVGSALSRILRINISLPPLLGRVLHSHWSRSLKILCSDWWKLNMLAPRSMP